MAVSVRPILVAAADFADHPSHPARSGTPILFPFPNRIRDGQFTFEGRNFRLPATNGPNAIHGFAMEAAWDVVEHKPTPMKRFWWAAIRSRKHSPDARPTLARRRRARGPIQPRRDAGFR